MVNISKTPWKVTISWGGSRYLKLTHLFPEIAWSRECNVTLVAFVWLFTTVRFQKSCIQGCSHIGYNCLTFLNCAFSDVSSNDVHKRIHSRIGCICLTFHHYGFSNVSSNCLNAKMQSHINCIFFVLEAPSAISFLRVHAILHNILGFYMILKRYLQYLRIG